MMIDDLHIFPFSMLCSDICTYHVYLYITVTYMIKCICMYIVPELEYLGGKVIFPGIEFNDTDPCQYLTDYLQYIYTHLYKSYVHVYSYVHVP